MGHLLFRGIELLAAASAAASIAYYVACIWAAIDFLRISKSPAGTAQFTPPISVLKPLKGSDPEMYESFRSHCLQDYPEYEILFGVSDPSDPTVPLVERLVAEFPAKSIRLVVCGDRLGANTKVSNLARLARECRFEHILVNDSDIRVEPDYLRRVVTPLQHPGIGLVTCLYRGIAGPTLGSRLEALGISTDFCAGVLVARQMEGIKFGLGSTLAFRRRELNAIGGFEALVDYLADDYQLGKRIGAMGLNVELSGVVVETFLPHYSPGSFFAHQLRWARTVRDSRFWGYVGLGVTFGFFWALVALVSSRGAAWAWGLLAATAVTRFAMALMVGRLVLRDRQVPKHLWLIPLRDLLGFTIWVASFVGHKISWRGEAFYLEKGKIVPDT
jgi:ceramide glucosyltransferase